MANYRRQTEIEVKKLDQEIEEKVKALSETKPTDPKFDKLVSEIHDLRTQKASKKSRLENMDKSGYIPDRITY